MKTSTGRTFQTIAVNLEAEQVRQMRALKAFTNLSLSDQARAALRAYLAGAFSVPSGTSTAGNSDQEH